MNRCFLTGSDDKTFWMVDWFLKNYRKHNKTPILFADFGLSQENREWVNVHFDGIVNVSKQRAEGWFYKPAALSNSPAHETCWIDTDIEVLDNIDGVWKYLTDNKLLMALDRPWTKRSGEEWYNSGVVGIRGKPMILKKWTRECKRNPSRGDQETLHLLTPTSLDKIIHIEPLPSEYNWLRIDLHDGLRSEKIKCVHWTGYKGKLKIEKLIYNA